LAVDLAVSEDIFGSQNIVNKVTDGMGDAEG
jgi:hypothetical protein